MHPVHNLQRRIDRTKALQKRFERSDDVLCVDWAEYHGHKAMAVAEVDRQGHCIASATTRTDTPEIEDAAIALALSSAKAKVIISDSKSAIINFAKGRISPEALGILRRFK